VLILPFSFLGVTIKAIFSLKVKYWDCYIYLTPLVPLSFKGEGEMEKEGLTPLLDALLGHGIFSKGIKGIGLKATSVNVSSIE